MKRIELTPTRLFDRPKWGGELATWPRAMAISSELRSSIPIRPHCVYLFIYLSVSHLSLSLSLSWDRGNADVSCASGDAMHMHLPSSKLKMDLDDPPGPQAQGGTSGIDHDSDTSRKQPKATSMAVDGEPARVKARVFIFVPRLGHPALTVSTQTRSLARRLSRRSFISEVSGRESSSGGKRRGRSVRWRWRNGRRPS